MSPAPNAISSITNIACHQIAARITAKYTNFNFGWGSPGPLAGFEENKREGVKDDGKLSVEENEYGWGKGIGCAPSRRGWRFGVAVTRWSRSTQLLYIEPG